MKRSNPYLALALALGTTVAWIIPIAVSGISGWGGRLISPAEVANAYTALPLEVPTVIFAWVLLVVGVGYFAILSAKKWIVRAIAVLLVPVLVGVSSSYAHSVEKNRIGKLPLEFAFDNAGRLFFFGVSAAFLAVAIGLFVFLAKRDTTPIRL